MDVPVWMTCVIGVGVVFAGLLFLILICSFMGLFFKNKPVEKKNTVKSAPVSTDNNIDPKERGNLVAAASVAIAESLGKDVSAIRIISFKKK